MHLGSDLNADDALMVAQHEATHSLLNRTTAHGAAILTFGGLARSSNSLRASNAEKCLVGLVDRCRTTHEVVATSWGAWAGNGDPDRLLDPYPGYVDYLDQARAIAPGWLERSDAKALAVLHFCRICMQTRILEQLLEAGTDAFSAGEMSDEDCPDLRFALLRETLDRAGWAELEEEGEERFATAGLADLFLHRDDSKHNFSRRSHMEFQRWLYRRFAAALASHGITTLDWEIYQRQADVLIKKLEDEGEGHLPGVQFENADDPREGQREALQVHRGERLMLKRTPPLVKVAYPDAWALPQHAVGRSEPPHHFLAVRPVARILEQYRMSSEGRELLEAGASDDLCAMTRTSRTRGDPPTTILWPIFEPADLDQMVAFWKGKAWFLPSISLSAMRNTAWSKRWMPSFESIENLTALIDCSPQSLLDEWEEAGIHYTVDPLRLAGPADLSRGALFACIPEKSPRTKYYAMCSVQTARRIEAYAQSSPAFRHTENPNTDPDEDLLTAHVAANLAGEPWFDFRADAEG